MRAPNQTQIMPIEMMNATLENPRPVLLLNLSVLEECQVCILGISYTLFKTKYTLHYRKSHGIPFNGVFSIAIIC